VNIALIFYQIYTHLASPLSWAVFLGGLCLGSFLNVCIYRLPRGIFFASARSHCPYCQALIPWYHNIPLLSFFLLRGRARCCGQPISPRYPAVELATGLLLLGFFWHYPFIGGSFPYLVIYPADFVRFAHRSVFVSALLVGSVIDWQLKIIPDSITLSLLALSPLVVYLHPELDWLSSLLGIIMGGGIIYLIAWIYYLLRRGYGIGMGDAKLLAAIGGWLGYQAIFSTILYGALLGSFYGVALMAKNRNYSLQTEIPFGPFLAFGAFLHMVWLT
jgi:leader peptidase (prepilin peptidase)/N-methyltransferase